jgi:hypothetical protein
MFLTFSGFQAQRQTTSDKIRATVLRRLSFCYLTPFLVVGANIGIGYGVTGNVGYGTFLCFVDNKIQNIITFIVPLIVTCVTNMIMFILTVTHINFDKKHLQIYAGQFGTCYFRETVQSDWHYLDTTGAGWSFEDFCFLLRSDSTDFISGYFHFPEFCKLVNYFKSFFKRKVPTQEPNDDKINNISTNPS